MAKKNIPASAPLSEFEKRALSLARQKFEETKRDQFKIISHIKDFFGGPLYVIEYYIHGADYLDTCFAHVTGNDIQLFTDGEEMAKIIGKGYHRGWISPILDLIQRAGVDGFLAVVISLTICYAFLMKFEFLDAQKTILTVLTSALTTIIGFYFGKHSDRLR